MSAFDDPVQFSNRGNAVHDDRHASRKNPAALRHG
jgi:hypothetical protein